MGARHEGQSALEGLFRLHHPGAVDADGHILEPPDLWERYLEPRYRDRALRIRKGDDGEYLEIAGRPSKLVRHGMPGGLGAMDRVGGIVYERPVTGLAYVDNAPFGAMDATERVERLDWEGLERVFLYPTLGVLWVAECVDEDLTQAYVRAYNRWLVDFCSEAPERLLPVAQLSLGDPVAAERELIRAARDGVVGVWVPPFTHSRKPLGHADHARVFAAAAEAGIPLGIHPAFEPKWAAPGRFGEMTSAGYAFFTNVTAGDAVRHAFTSLFQSGVFEQHSSLRVVVLECGASWVGYWLDRMDAVWVSPQGRPVRKVLPELPSHYFKRQCWISADPDETTLAGVMSVVGDDRFFWASDFPHPDHPPDYLEHLARLVEPMSIETRAKLLGRNVLQAYGIDRAVKSA